MEAKELKIGNRFIRELRNSHGLEYDHDFVLTEEWMGKLFGSDLSIALEDLFPVPLTPEILEKAGFEESQDGFFYNEDATFRIHNNRTLIDMSFVNPENDSTYFVNIGDVLYLHQLQNLIHALIGEELQIEL